MRDKNFYEAGAFLALATAMFSGSILADRSGGQSKHNRRVGTRI
jgi:hypothetical protein